MLAAEIALYPQGTKNCDEVIEKSVRVLGQQGLSYKVGPVSTFVEGEPAKVWGGLKAMYEEAGKHDCEVNMVVQLRQM